MIQAKRKLSALCILMSLAALPPSALTQDLQVSASVSTDTIGVQDQFQLTITVSGSDSAQAQTPRLPRFQGFQVVAGPSLSTQFQWINGRSTSSKSFIYILLPEKEGQYTLDPIEVTAGGKTYRTQPIQMRVTAASRTAAPPVRRIPSDPFGTDAPPARSNARSGDEIYISAELDRTSAFPGQQVTLAYHLYTQVGVTGIQLQDNPPLTGFWVENLEVESKPSGTRRIIGGREYTDYVIKKQALFANTAGRLKIPTSTFAISVRVQGDFFGLFGQTETVYRKTREIILDVRPLPEQDRPQGFNNAVGSFNLTSELNRPEAAAGDALLLRVKLAGKGNLKEIPDIPLPAMPDLTVYSSKQEDSVRPVAGDQIGGEKTWEYVIIPKVPGDETIPALSFSYFDPERERYETISTQPIALKVTRGADTSTGIAGLAGLTKQNLTRQGTDINFIKLSGEALAPRPGPLYASPWFYVLAALSLCFSLGAFLYRREQARRAGNAVLARSRKARRQALARLRKAEKAGRASPQRFYDEAGIALAGYLGDKFNLPQIAITADTLERTLEENSVAAETVREAVMVLQECDFGRFVSASQAPERREALARRMRGIIDVLERAER